ncbi:MAG: septum formation initiator family protein [Wenyingzhuangia sp.]|jgi:cell division protein DivIC|uniref:FtsB family cell division protein n=1 Tax=Wenyingzhuangia sp. TaxID=1964193 RepID=UPI00321C001D
MKWNLKNKKTSGTILSVFIIWMIFFDANSYLRQMEYNQQIDKLENAIDFYNSEIEKNRKTIQEHSIQKKVNNFAREEYHYKKENEVLYLIEYDTIE